MMFLEIDSLFSYLGNVSFKPDDVKKAIVVENCLSKKSQNNREITYRNLHVLYILDSSSFLFRAFQYYWWKDENARRLLAFLVCYKTDPMVSIVTQSILEFQENKPVPIEHTKEQIKNRLSSKLTDTTLLSLTQNLRSTLTQTGHLSGKQKKIRTRPNLSSGAVCFSLLLGYLEGVRGELLFQTDYMKAIECSPERGYNFAFEASSKGWIDFKKAGNVVDVRFSVFPDLQS